VVGGGDSAVETALALDDAGAKVTLCHRGSALRRPNAANLARLEQSRVIRLFDTRVRAIAETSVEIETRGEPRPLPNDVVFVMIGREAPLDFFRRSGIPIRGEWRLSTWLGLLAFFAFTFFLYNWKAGGAINQAFVRHRWFPYNVSSIGDSPLAQTLSLDLKEPGFYYSVAYSVCVALFGVARIRRRRTPYVTRQTLALLAVQLVPLFLIPYFALPWAGHAGLFDRGIAKSVADALFPVVDYGQGREYWRAFGLVLAWPLFIWNFFTAKPMTWWLLIGCIQTFVILPLLIRRYGKGVYCGFICSCGALAETLGDEQRENLLAALALLSARVVSWSAPTSTIGYTLERFYNRWLSNNTLFGFVALDYYHVVDLFLAGVVGLGTYFWLSGRVWCRFACPLAALMHIYARFSRFRIFADKPRCISCNLCTQVCHQGIDVMSFANQGRPMEDPECVRCSACVAVCPTGTLQFGHLDGNRPIYDRIPASPVLIREAAIHLRVLR
jgi:polyferredoxin